MPCMTIHCSTLGIHLSQDNAKIDAMDLPWYHWQVGIRHDFQSKVFDFGNIQFGREVGTG